MEKNTLLSKLNIKDYNNELEKILDKKVFSIDVKNLLLSMLYKIENAYSDYQEVKRQVPSKNTYIENIINIIQNECEIIDIIKTDSKNGEKIKEKKFKYEIDRLKKKIVSVDNENALLETIIMVSKNMIRIPEHYKFLGDAFNYVLNIGYGISDSEVINDFNGWSWDISNLSNEEANCNVIFKTLLYSIGNEILYEFVDNNNVTADYIKILNSELNKKYGKKNGEELKNQLYICLISMYLRKHPDVRELIIKENEEYKKKLSKMDNKEKFICELTIEKIKYSKKVEKIDLMLNDYEQLKKGYSGLSDDEKELYISISEYETKLEKERKGYLQEIKSINNLISPKEYVKIKEELQNIINTLECSLNNNVEEEIVKFCKVFLKGFAKKIEKVDNKKDLIEYIYELRYYRFLQFNKKSLKDIAGLREDFEYVMKLLIGKACNLKVLETICEDYEVNYKVLKIIFDTKIINLKDINFECKQKDDTLYLQYFDSKMYESTIEIKINSSIKIKKRVKLFIH